jgi:hypothetical protein
MEARIVDREVGTMVRASTPSRDREEARRAKPNIPRWWAPRYATEMLSAAIHRLPAYSGFGEVT